MTLPDYLEALKRAANQAAAAEEQFRRDILPRTRTLERERAFAFRRLDFMGAIAEAVASADSEEIAVAAANGVLRARLGWASDSEARDEVIVRFVPVAQAMFADFAPPEEAAVVQVSTAAADTKPDVAAELAAFETWYAETHPNPFWVLFENVIPETPLVDF